MGKKNAFLRKRSNWFSLEMKDKAWQRSKGKWIVRPVRFQAISLTICYCTPIELCQLETSSEPVDASRYRSLY